MYLTTLLYIILKQKKNKTVISSVEPAVIIETFCCLDEPLKGCYYDVAALFTCPAD